LEEHFNNFQRSFDSSKNSYAPYKHWTLDCTIRVRSDRARRYVRNFTAPARRAHASLRPRSNGSIMARHVGYFGGGCHDPDLQTLIIEHQVPLPYTVYSQTVRIAILTIPHRCISC
jgi:hypothetical protein